jgi:hypothetical protein
MIIVMRTSLSIININFRNFIESWFLIDHKKEPIIVQNNEKVLGIKIINETKDGDVQKKEEHIFKPNGIISKKRKVF